MNARVLKHEKENHEVMNIIYEGRGGHEGDKELGKDPGVRPGKRFCVLLQSHDKPSRDFWQRSGNDQSCTSVWLQDRLDLG